MMLIGLEINAVYLFRQHSSGRDYAIVHDCTFNVGDHSRWNTWERGAWEMRTRCVMTGYEAGAVCADTW